MEETVEIIVFLGIAILLLGLISAFIYEWKLSDDTHALSTLYRSERANPEMKVDKTGFMVQALEFWNFCNHTSYGTPRILNVYNSERVTAGTLTKAEMFDYYRNLSLCKSIQSASHACGAREDVAMETLTLPAVVELRCTDTSLAIT